MSLTTTHLVHYILCIFAHTCYLHVAVTNTFACEDYDCLSRPWEHLPRKTYLVEHATRIQGRLHATLHSLCVCMHACVCMWERGDLIDWLIWHRAGIAQKQEKRPSPNTQKSRTIYREHSKHFLRHKTPVSVRINHIYSSIWHQRYMTKSSGRSETVTNVH